MKGHWFWALVTAACLLWYSTITVYVAFKGLLDIRHMLRRLGRGQDKEREIKKEAGS